MAQSNNKNNAEYRNLSDEALLDTIVAEKSQLQKLKFGHSMNPIENPMAIRQIRRHIAQLTTEQRKRELGI